MTTLGRLQIRYGTPADATYCQQLARKRIGTRPAFRDKLEAAARDKTLFVADLDGERVGFAYAYRRRDGWHTLHELAVDEAAAGLGIGRALLYAVPAPIRLKCPVGFEANTFYQNAGMRLIGTDTRNPKVNVYERNVLVELVFGGKKEAVDWARQSGMAYGVRGDYTPHDWPYAFDIKWKDYDWRDYLHKVSAWHPAQAMAADYEHPSQRRMLYQQLRDLKAAGVLRVMVCPKFEGAIAHIPCWCVVALSVYSQYAGWLPKDFNELRGRRVHLLGGVPQDWLDLIPKLRGHGAHVLSVDGNSHESAAKKGSHFEGGVWVNKGKKADYHHTVVYSGRQIARIVDQYGGAIQAPMFAA